VAENGTAVTTVVATDVDAGTTIVYSVSGGADAARFAINATTGALSFVAAPNFEAPTDAGGDNVYNVIVQASDGALVDTQAIAVTVTNVNEAPVITSNLGGATAAVSVAENLTAVTTVVSVDVDAGTTIVYAITGGADAARFAINAATGALSFIAGPNFEVPVDAGGDNVYDVIVQASDGALTDSQTLAVTVTDSTVGVTITGTTGNDTISSSQTVAGQPFATEEADSISGLDGNDTLNGGAGNDTLLGGIGNDVITGGSGADSLNGGDGTDTLSYAASLAGVSVDLATGAVSGGDAAGDTIAGFERVTGSALNDSLTGDALNNLLSGGAGNDVLVGVGGNDTLTGGDGADNIRGGMVAPPLGSDAGGGRIVR